jgi:hypothetical protein
MTGFGINGAEPSGSAIRELVELFAVRTDPVMWVTILYKLNSSKSLFYDSLSAAEVVNSVDRDEKIMLSGV